MKDKYVYCFLWVTQDLIVMHSHTQPVTDRHANAIALELGLAGALLVSYGRQCDNDRRRVPQ